MKPIDYILQAFIIAATLSFYCYNAYAEEDRIKIGIIDTGLNISKYEQWICKTPASIDFTSTTINDNNNHGTNVFHLITHDLDPAKYCVVIIKYLNISDTMLFEFFRGSALEGFEGLAGMIFRNSYLRALKYASDSKLQYLNLSLGGFGSDPIEVATLKYILDNKTIVVAAAGNSKKNLTVKCDYFPACNGYKELNFIVVGSKDDNDIVSKFSNYGGPVDAYEYGEFQGPKEVRMSGTSQATANYLNRLVRMKK